MGTNSREVGTFGRAVAAELRAELARKNVSMRRFSVETGLPLSTLQKTLAGTRVADVEDLYAICAGLGIDPDEIFRRAQAELDAADPNRRKAHAERKRRMLG
ncbi:helix-turn-helix transcriptional regulator [Sinomonas sp. JGH33]|uniref:Helix-turn-helix transcriptional regulator n=1 Tax=Sinomonas terricola TaxID=3110330 RepID=A0ABU5T4B4_9MICC|nr:helix-turn-helix transcriptional regulator [Sinomonas sp. JGH33]MEA5454500.1 helix-turn-helix transcriptional regulator [Sinomonas sp. JGH33]